MSLIVSAARTTSSQIDVTWTTLYSFLYIGRYTPKSFIVNVSLSAASATTSASNSDTQNQEWIVFLPSPNGRVIGGVRLDMSRLTVRSEDASTKVTVKGCDDERHTEIPENYSINWYRIGRSGTTSVLAVQDVLTTSMGNLSGKRFSQQLVKSIICST